MRLSNGLAIKFWASRRFYEVAADVEATEFPFADDADWFARERGMREGQFTVSEILEEPTTKETK